VHPKLVNQVPKLEGLINELKPALFDERLTVVVVTGFLPSLRDQYHRFLLSRLGSTAEPESPL
jgi:hypothetical protein